MKRPMRSTKVAAVIPKSDCQYCVNMVAAMVKVTMLMQFANLVPLAESCKDGVCRQDTDQYIIPTVNPRASSTKVWGKSISGAATGRTDTISARDRMTENMTRPANMKARRAPTGPPSAMTSPDVWKIPMPTAPEKAIPEGLNHMR
ncbi:MAG: hypothetical protein Q9171_003491 [Xanthocarpia ochracea]